MALKTQNPTISVVLAEMAKNDQNLPKIGPKIDDFLKNVKFPKPCLKMIATYPNLNKVYANIASNMPKNGILPLLHFWSS